MSDTLPAQQTTPQVDQPISRLPVAYAADVTDDDSLEILDATDVTQAPTGTNKRLPWVELVAAMTAALGGGAGGANEVLIAHEPDPAAVELELWVDLDAATPAGPAGPPGADGAPGPAGPPGADGAPGQGVPTGGTPAQVLTKTGPADYATAWQDATGGGAGVAEVSVAHAPGPTAAPLELWVNLDADPAGTGTGIPPGGSTNEALVKVSAADYDVDWSSPLGSAAYVDTDTLARSRWGGNFYINRIQNASGAVDLNLYNGNVQHVTLGGNVTFNAPTNMGGAAWFVSSTFRLVLVENNPGGWTVAWWPSIVWPGGTPPVLGTAANRTNVVEFLTMDNTHWLGWPLALDMR